MVRQSTGTSTAEAELGGKRMGVGKGKMRGYQAEESVFDRAPERLKEAREYGVDRDVRRQLAQWRRDGQR